MLMTNYSEKDMLSVAVEIIKKYPSGIDTQNLVKQLTKIIYGRKPIGLMMIG